MLLLIADIERERSREDGLTTAAKGTVEELPL